MRFAAMLRIIGVLLVSAPLVYSLPQAVRAQSEVTAPPAEAPTGSPVTASAVAPVLSAESAILIDAESGTVLLDKDADRTMYPASITKIITAIVALESADLNDIVTVSKTARGEDGTRVYLAEGEQVTLEKLIYAMMLNSGNDAATAIAEHVDGSKEQFALRMDAFVREKAGATGTRSKNPSGLPDPEHVTTARDMAKIAQYAMRNETFRTIVSTKKMPWQGKEWQSSLINHNKLLGTYEGTTGIKNGYTNAAGSTLVASASRGGMELIGVVLKSASSAEMYKDMTRLLDYGFENFERKSVFALSQSYLLQTGESQREFVADRAVSAVVPKGEEPSYVVNVDGSISLLTPLGRQPIGKLTPLSAPGEESAAATVLADDSSGAVAGGRSAFEYMVLVFWLLLNVFLGFLGYLLYRKKKKSKAEGLRYRY